MFLLSFFVTRYKNFWPMRITSSYKWLKAVFWFCFTCTSVLQLLVLGNFSDKTLWRNQLWYCFTHNYKAPFFSMVTKVLRYRGEPHIEFRMQCVIMKQITWPPLLTLYTRHFYIFAKIHSFLKNLLNVPDSKKSILQL